MQESVVGRRTKHAETLKHSPLSRRGRVCLQALTVLLADKLLSSLAGLLVEPIDKASLEPQLEKPAKFYDSFILLTRSHAFGVAAT
jgi:hypothetical protein